MLNDSQSVYLLVGLGGLGLLVVATVALFFLRRLIKLSKSCLVLGALGLLVLVLALVLLLGLALLG